MKNLLKHLRLGVLLTVLFASLPLFSQDTLILSDNFTLIRECESYILEYHPSDFLLDTIYYNGDLYSFIKFNDMQYVHYTEEPGKPELPFYSINLQIPERYCDVTIMSEPLYPQRHRMHNRSSEPSYPIENDCVSFPTNLTYYPTQICAGDDACETLLDTAFYENSQVSWLSENYYYDSVSQPYMNFAKIALNIIPCQYIPMYNCVQQLPPTRFIISFNCNYNICDMIDETLNNVVWASDAVNFFDNYTEDEFDIDAAMSNIAMFPFFECEHCYPTLDTSYKGDYLIIVQDGYEDNIETFKAHKILYGYHVTVLSLSDISSDVTSEDIRQKIKQIKEDNEFLKYVLLVGEDGVIPPSEHFTGIDGYEHDTDIFYASLNDSWFPDLSLQPELYVGRWVIENSNDLASVIQKTILAETYQTSGSVIFASGTGEGEEEFKRANIDVINMLYDYNIASSNVIGMNSNAPSLYLSFMHSNNNYMIWTYRGHGNEYQIGSPYFMDYYDFITDSVYIPFGMAFACSANSMNSNALGQKILTSSEMLGSSTFYGSSGISFRSSNNKLEKSVFGMLEKRADITIGQMLVGGAQKYYDGWRLSGYKQEQYKKYNISGDPSLYLYGLDPSGYPNTSPAQSNLRRSGKSLGVEYIGEVSNINSDESIIKIEIYDILGNLLMSRNTAAIGDLPNNTYVMIITTSNGIYAKKMFVNH